MVDLGSCRLAPELAGRQVMSASGSSTYRDSGFKRGRWRHSLKMLKVLHSFKEGKWALNHGMFLNWTAIYLRGGEREGIIVYYTSVPFIHPT